MASTLYRKDEEMIMGAGRAWQGRAGPAAGQWWQKSAECRAECSGAALRGMMAVA